MKDEVWVVSSYRLDIWLIHHLIIHGCKIWPDGAGQSLPFLVQFQPFLEWLTAFCVHPSLLIQIKKRKCTLWIVKIPTILIFSYLSKLTKKTYYIHSSSLSTLTIFLQTSEWLSPFGISLVINFENSPSSNELYSFPFDYQIVTECQVGAF